MAIDLEKWLLRHLSVTGEGAPTMAFLLAGDETKEWDSWELDPQLKPAEQARSLAASAQEVVKALGLELPKRRHAFVLQLKAGVPPHLRHLGQQTLSVTGTSTDSALQASQSDAVAQAMLALAALWKQSLETAGVQLNQAVEHNARLHDEVLRLLNAEIDRKKAEAENATITSEQTEKVVTLLQEQLPALIEITRGYMKKD